MVAPTTLTDTQFTSNQQAEALQDLGTTLGELNSMQNVLAQTLASNANNLQETIASAIAASSTAGGALGNNLRAASNNLVNQMVITDILEDEVRNAETAYEDLKQNNIDQLRMVDINTYYTEKYRAQTDLMKLIIYFAIPILLIAILANKGIIGNSLAYGLGGLILFIGVVCVIMMLLDINNRDPMNFREYNIDVDIKAEEQAEKAGDLDPWDAISYDSEAALKALERELGVACVGRDCCDEPYTVFDKKLGMCVPGKNAPAYPTGSQKGAHWEQASKTKGKDKQGFPLHTGGKWVQNYQ
jgi:hypothetical protein